MDLVTITESQLDDELYTPTKWENKKNYQLETEKEQKGGDEPTSSNYIIDSYDIMARLDNIKERTSSVERNTAQRGGYIKKKPDSNYFNTEDRSYIDSESFFTEQHKRY